METKIDFSDPIPPGLPVTVLLPTPPMLRLAPPEHGRIDLFIGEQEAFAPVMLSDVSPPLDDLWFWSCAVASGLLPATVRLHDERADFFLIAVRVPGDKLRLTVACTAHASLPDGPPRACIAWEEERRDFLARWGGMWADWVDDPTADWSQWGIDPEPILDMPWTQLSAMSAFEPAPWPRAARVGWFWLQMAHQLRSHGHGCEYNTNPARWTLRELAFAGLTLQTLHRAWSALNDEAPPDDADCCARIRAARALACGEGREDVEPEDDFTGLGNPLDRAYYRAQWATDRYREQVVEALLRRLPIAPGSAFADEHGKRVTLIETRGCCWTVYREDGQVNQEDCFHVGRRAAWRWPVAEGPSFDAQTLDPIDRGRLAFMRQEVSPVRVVCPCCAYPCMDDDQDEVNVCDICGWPLWRLVSAPLPALDDAADEDGNPIRPTLRAARRHFLDHGDAYPLDEPDPTEWRLTLRAHRDLAAACRTEWDAWLANPDPAHLPEEVWRRVARLKTPVNRT